MPCTATRPKLPNGTTYPCAREHLPVLSTQHPADLDVLDPTKGGTYLSFKNHAR